MSGNPEQSAKFDELVTENIFVHNMNVHGTQKMLQGINMRAKNLQGNISGINLEHRKMSKIRNQLYVDVIRKKSALEDEMLQKVIDASECHRDRKWSNSKSATPIWLENTFTFSLGEKKFWSRYP